MAGSLHWYYSTTHSSLREQLIQKIVHTNTHIVKSDTNKTEHDQDMKLKLTTPSLHEQRVQCALNTCDPISYDSEGHYDLDSLQAVFRLFRTILSAYVHFVFKCILMTDCPISKRAESKKRGGCASISALCFSFLSFLLLGMLNLVQGLFAPFFKNECTWLNVCLLQFVF